MRFHKVISQQLAARPLKRGGLALACSVLLGGLAGCAAQPPTHYYDLTPVVTSGQPLLKQSLTLGVGPVTMPDVLDRPGVVTRLQGTNVNVANFHIWAGELKPAFTRVLAASVAGATQLDQVWPSPWDNRFRPEYQVRVFVDRFSGELNGAVELNLSWTLLADFGQEVILTRRYQAQRQSPGNYAGYVETLNLLVADFATELSTQLPQHLPTSDTQ